MGNKPQKGEVLSWAESSAVVYANSVLGARCNRNSGIIDIMGSIVGYVPYFGLLTDEGRRATWVIKVQTTKKPEAQLQICGATINKEPWARSKLLLRAFLHKRKTRESPCETRFFCYSLKLSVPFCTFVAQSDTALRKSRSPVSQMITLLSHRWPTISAVEKRAF